MLKHLSFLFISVIILLIASSAFAAGVIKLPQTFRSFKQCYTLGVGGID